MKLHTKEQAPKEGQRAPEQKPMVQVRAPPRRPARSRRHDDLALRCAAVAPPPDASRCAHLRHAQWQPTKEGYLSFLIESKAVYDCMEGIVAKDSNPICACFAARGAPGTRSRGAAHADAKFRNTGLERGAALEKDIAWMKAQARVRSRFRRASAEPRR